MTDILKEKENSMKDRDTQEKCHVMTEAETGVWQWQAKVHQLSMATTRSQGEAREDPIQSLRARISLLTPSF